ncbi:hypothetical protein WOLCODRAFT_151354 [Wolfiporia cocos MD-104 SS10]|uniref:Uncharacterized protein n=1 Tax=Wolfiporia cocos (strain MD-104) TaxID=742152 RepID=A0A2H3JGK0_WOLCO|nr:hypothetical protein WOLCODRAFT_151354 [Wolfiporia cocos MD-104 SS10]
MTQEEYWLLQNIPLESRSSNDHELRTAPVFTREAYVAAGGAATFPQRGLLGLVLETFDKDGKRPEEESDDPRLYINSNAPFSALVCGVQGSGKSHTVSVMLENMLIPNHSPIGSNNHTLSGLVLHFGEGGPYSQPCEAAWLGIRKDQKIKLPRIQIYVSNSSLNTMKAVYNKQVATHISVAPLLFSEAELDAQAFLSMMAIGATDHVPLYMQTVLSILRDLGEKYTYQKFKQNLEEKKKKFNPAQLSGIEQRMALLESFLDKPAQGKPRAAPVRFAPGQLTIIDLSDPFIDPASACGLFEIITRLFVRAQLNVGTAKVGKVLVVDEAHKVTVISADGLNSEQPTVVPPVLLELCSVAILHRFSSPAWWEHVAKHVSADVGSKEAFDKVVNLQTGQAMLLAPAGLSACRASTSDKLDYSGNARTLRQFGRRCVLIKTRQRVTRDGGASILVVNTEG